MRKPITTFILAVAMLLASFVPCAQAQFLEIEAKMPKVSLVATPTPVPMATPSPATIATSNPTPEPVQTENYARVWDWFWTGTSGLIILFGLFVTGFLVVRFFWFLFSLRKKNNKPPDENETPDKPTHEDEQVTEMEIVKSSTTTSSTPNESNHADEPAETREYPRSITPMLELTDAHRKALSETQKKHRSTQDTVIMKLAEEPENPDADKTHRSGPGAAVIIFLAFGLSLAQAGTATAASTCTPTKVTEGAKLVKGQKEKVVEIMTTNCENPNAIVVVPGVEFTQVSFSARSGLITAKVKASEDAETGKFRFFIRDGKNQILSSKEVTFSIWDVPTAEVHNEGQEVKVNTQKATSQLSSEVSKEIEALKLKVRDLEEMEYRHERRLETTLTKEDVAAIVEPLRATVATLEKGSTNLEEIEEEVKANTRYIGHLALGQQRLANDKIAKGGFSGLLGGKKFLDRDVAIAAQRILNELAKQQAKETGDDIR